MPGRDDPAGEAALLSPAELVGAWQLVEYGELRADGTLGEGPLGPRPRGVLIYEPHGHMSVSMMRGDAASGAVGVRTGPAVSSTGFMGYAATWRVVGRRILHHVQVSTHAYQLDQELIREARLEEGRLTLGGTVVLAGRPRHRVLVWRRSAPRTHDPAPPDAARGVVHER
ncbi:lipocalin-like domain-containing protein [Streptomyces sp. NPDC058773]|uniref:lipocalin-like domain-containing protein n=1 Tax=Streptomyces sp. NPDC058773 TaxID=3346632 RepID=UPI0036BA1552